MRCCSVLNGVFEDMEDSTSYTCRRTFPAVSPTRRVNATNVQASRGGCDLVRFVQTRRGETLRVGLQITDDARLWARGGSVFPGSPPAVCLCIAGRLTLIVQETDRDTLVPSSGPPLKNTLTGCIGSPVWSRGRPRKAESRKGAHLRKSVPNMPSSLRNPNDGPPRKRGRPRTTQKSEDVAPRKKRGRPKGSVNKNKGRSETQLDGAKHSKEKSDSPAVEVECEGEPVEAVVEHDVHETEETLIEQDANFEVSDQA
ncbi:hypothetical protein F2P81_023353 [Scophthalmus maximus]|uniref:Uncharacterized protein n=1 Tax=Scophthalmus maximus TaxID=52904 RepID=A0A6A4S029_SCOMX|nr:hypothetical protein F2P81_023353 [Scophthalmus maximus]